MDLLGAESMRMKKKFRILLRKLVIEKQIYI